MEYFEFNFKKGHYVQEELGKKFREIEFHEVFPVDIGKTKKPS